MITSPLRTYGSASSIIQHGTLGGANPTVVTIGMWLKFHVLANNKGLFERGNVSTPFQRLSFKIQVVGGLGETRIFQSGTVFSAFISSNALIPANVPVCVFAIHDQSAGQQGRLFLGDLQRSIFELALGTNSNGSGFDNISTYNAEALNIAAGSPGTSEDMSCWAYTYVEGAWTIQQMQDWMMNPRMIDAPTRQKLMVLPGRDNIVAKDLSGNGYHGTIAGAVPTNDCLPRVLRRAS